ncbi:MAG: N-acetyltransferase [Thermodesulfobacteriota bacterium]
MVRKATIKDVKEIFSLVEALAKKGAMLPRPLSEIYSNLRDFYIYEDNDQLLGICALHICWEDLAEVRSLSVRKGAEKRGIGRLLVEACIEEARTLGVSRVFALTYQDGFFTKAGFRVIDRGTLPHKIWTDCIKCTKFPDCDETAVILDI